MVVARWLMRYVTTRKCARSASLVPPQSPSMSTRGPRPAASACSARVARRTTSSSCLTRTWNWPRRSSGTARSAVRVSAASPFLSPSRLVRRKKLFVIPSRTQLLPFASAMAWTPASKWVRSSPNKASSASSRLFPQASAKAQRPSWMAATRKFPATNPAISSRRPSSTACLPLASSPTRKFLARYSVSFTPIPSMKRWIFSAAAPTATKPRSSPPAVPPRANFATRPPREISASISASPPRWPISHSADGKKVSSASFTGRDATPLNFSPNPKSWSSAGHARKRASSELPLMITKPLHLDMHEQIECAQTLASRFYTDPAILEIEKARIFRRTWQLVGTLNQACGEVNGVKRTISDPESFFTAELAGEPIIIVRDKEGVLRAFSNVCRHRAGPIALGSGCKNVLRCQYHGWTYTLDGRLIGTPDVEGVEFFDRSTMGIVPLRRQTRAPFFLYNTLVRVALREWHAG